MLPYWLQTVFHQWHKKRQRESPWRDIVRYLTQALGGYEPLKLSPSRMTLRKSSVLPETNLNENILRCQYMSVCSSMWVTYPKILQEKSVLVTRQIKLHFIATIPQFTYTLSVDKWNFRPTDLLQIFTTNDETKYVSQLTTLQSKVAWTELLQVQEQSVLSS